MKTNIRDEEQRTSLTDQQGIGRREFIKTAGLAAVGLGAGHITKVK